MVSPRKTQLLLVGALVAVLLMGSISDSQAQTGKKIELIYASYLAPTMGISQNSVRYLKELEKVSGGMITVKNFSYLSAMFGASDLIPACGKGLCHIAIYAPLYTSALLPMAPLTEMPYCTEKLGADAYAKAMLYEKFEPYRKQYDDAGVKILVFIPSSPASMGVRARVNSLEECVGTRMRAYGMIAECLQAAGITPIALSVSDVHTGMQRGTIDGWAGLPLAGLEGTGLLEVSKTIIDPGFGMYGSCGIAMTLSLYNQLPDNVKNWIEKMRTEYVREMANFEFELDLKTALVVKEKKLNILVPSNDQKKAFQNKVNPEKSIWAKYIKQIEDKKLPGQEGFNIYMKYVKEWEPKSPWRNPFE